MYDRVNIKGGKQPMVQSPVKSVRDPALNAKLNYIFRYKPFT